MWIFCARVPHRNYHQATTMVNVALVEHALDKMLYVMKSFKLIITLKITREEIENESERFENVLHMFMDISYAICVMIVKC